ncbi:MAG: hypothetical protein IJ344_06390 [Clostridia bacterium]|nr:hypothetical protein [Clostridia bacterium]
MAQDHKRELSPDELLKKLLTSFGEDPEEDGEEQLTIEDSAQMVREQSRPKVYRVKADKQEQEVSPEKEPDIDKEELERQIRRAELFVAGMRESKDSDDSDKEEQDFEIKEDRTMLKKNREDVKDAEIPPAEKEEREEEKEPVRAEAAPEQEVCLDKEPVTEERRFFRKKKNKKKRHEEVVQEAVQNPVPEEPEAFDDTEQDVLEPEQERVVTAKEKMTEREHADEKDIGIAMLFGDKKELEDAIGAEELRLRERSLEGDATAETVKEEYVSADQNGRFFKKLRTAYTVVNVRLLFAVLAFLAVAFLEIGMPILVQGGASLQMLVGPFLEEIFNHPVMTALAGMQVTMLLAAVGYKELFAGFRAVGSGRSAPQIYFAALFSVTLLYEFGLIFCHNVQAPFYNLPLALAALMAVLFTRMNISRTVLSFKIVSSKRPKYAVTHRTSGDAALEREVFGQYLDEYTGVFGVGQTAFVKNFAKRNAREPRYKSSVMIVAAVAVLTGIVFCVLGYQFSGQSTGSGKLLSALVMAMQAVLFCIPVSAFVTYALPFYKASKKAFRMESAIIGEFSLEEYADANVVSFDDKEIFPAKNVKVRSLKLYGDTRIDHVLFGAASVFHRLGGPLDEVFGVATKESGYTDKVELLEVVCGGVEAAVDGELVCVGNGQFMRQKGLLSSIDPDDTALEMEGTISVMYLSIGSELAAKMYIEYVADKEVEGIMASLYKAGICIGIRTLDPNIDDRMFAMHADLSKYPVKVLRMDGERRQSCYDTLDSGVVSKKNVKSLLKTLSFCRRVLQVIRTNTVIKILSVLAGIGVSALILYMSYAGKIAGVYEINSLWIVLYQLCWTLPALIISLIFV